MTNLISNAVKFTPPRGAINVSVTVEPMSMIRKARLGGDEYKVHPVKSSPDPSRQNEVTGTEKFNRCASCPQSGFTILEATTRRSLSSVTDRVTSHLSRSPRVLSNASAFVRALSKKKSSSNVGPVDRTDDSEYSMLLISVSDSGAGIRQEDIPRCGHLDNKTLWVLYTSH